MASYEIHYTDGERSVLGNVTSTEVARQVARVLHEQTGRELKLYRVSEVALDQETV